MRVVSLEVRVLMQLESYDLEFSRESYEFLKEAALNQVQGQLCWAQFDHKFNEVKGKIRLCDKHESCGFMFNFPTKI